MEFIRVFVTHHTILAGILLLSLGVWAYFDDRRDHRNVALSSMLMTAAFWSFSHVLWRAALVPGQGLFWIHTIYFISSLLPVLFLFYAVAVSTGRLPALWVQVAALATNAIIFWMSYGSNIVASIDETGQLTYGNGRTIVALHFGIFFLLGLAVLLYTARTNTDLKTSRLLASGVGAIIAFNPVFTLLSGAVSRYDSASFWVGNLALVTGMLVITVLSVRRRMLIDIRLLGSEFFILLTISVIIIDVIVSETLLDFTFKLVFLVILVLYGAFLTRSLVREARRLREIEQLNEQIMTVNRRLVAADRMKSKFVAFASHQLRTPLAGVKSYMSMLEGGDFGALSEEQQSIIRLNMEAIERLSVTVDTFLDVAKLELGRADLTRTVVTVHELVTPVVEHLQGTALDKGLNLQVRNEHPDTRVHVDAGRLYHAMANLIDNAVKYSEEGTIVVNVHVDSGQLYFTVTDEGQGLDDKALEKLRLIFKIGIEAVHFDERGGSGMGMHIVKKIIEAHDGEVQIESDGPGKGSTFGFSIPIE